jgi:hypothetical protein
MQRLPNLSTHFEYADKKEEVLSIKFCNRDAFLNVTDRFKKIPNVDQLHRQNYHIIKSADYKHELLGERLTTTQKTSVFKKLPKAVIVLAFVLFLNARKHVSNH